jgi:hypothetical protein
MGKKVNLGARTETAQLNKKRGKFEGETETETERGVLKLKKGSN